MLDQIALIFPRIVPFLQIIAYVIATASLIVKVTPTLADDNTLKPIIKFIGKFLALDKYGPKGE